MTIYHGIAASWDANNAKATGMGMSEQLVALWLRNRELVGKGPATREEMLRSLKIGDRTLDDALAWLNKHGLLVKVRG